MIGILGFGRFGKLMATYLAKDFDVLVYNRSDNADAILASGAKPASLDSGLPSENSHSLGAHICFA